MDIRFFYRFLLNHLSREEKLQILRLLNAFAKCCCVSDSLEYHAPVLLCRANDDLIIRMLNGHLGPKLPRDLQSMYQYLKENYCQELLEDGFIRPSQEYLEEVYPELLRLFLPYGEVVVNHLPPYPLNVNVAINRTLEVLGVQSVCDLTANGSSERVLLSAVLSWIALENNSNEDPDNHVLFDAVIDYDFLYEGRIVNLATVESAARLRTDKYVLLFTYLDGPHPDFLKGGKLVSVQKLGMYYDRRESYLLVFDMRGGYDTVTYPEGKKRPYSELLKCGGKLDY